MISETFQGVARLCILDSGRAFQNIALKFIIALSASLIEEIKTFGKDLQYTLFIPRETSILSEVVNESKSRLVFRARFVPRKKKKKFFI